MAFKASVAPLARAFEEALQVAWQEKGILNTWHAQLAGNMTGIDAMNMNANLTRVLGVCNTTKALPGLAAYARGQFGDGAYDVVAEFNSMVSALQAVQTWLTTNIPSNAVNLSGGVLNGNTYTPAQTSALRTLIDTARKTIS